MPFESSFLVHLKLIKKYFFNVNVDFVQYLRCYILTSWNIKVGTIFHSLMNFWCPKLPSWNIPKFHRYWKSTLWNKNPYPWFYTLCVCERKMWHAKFKGVSKATKTKREGHRERDDRNGKGYGEQVCKITRRLTLVQSCLRTTC